MGKTKAPEKITEIALKRLTSADDGKALREPGGLVGKVRAGKRGVTVQFRFEFWQAGSKHDYRLGSWPKKSLADMRAERNEIKPVIGRGIDPTAAKKAARIESQRAVDETLRRAEAEQSQRKTVADLFNVWIADGVSRKDDNKELKRLFDKDILPAIGRIELRKLTDNHIRAMARKMMERGVTRQVIVALRDTRQMLSWGEQRKPWRGLLENGNPADLVEVDTLLPDYDGERDRVLSVAEIRELARTLTRMREDYEAAPAGTKYDTVRPLKRESELALWICLGTLCRIGELLMAEWRHVDLDAGLWNIPKDNVKGRGKKRQDHHIFLSDFARRQFEALKEITGESAWLFPARNKVGEETHVCVKSISKQVGDRQEKFKQRKPLARRRHDNTLVLAGGESGEWTPHDLRRTGATMMQALGISLDVIDRCQNHMLPGKVRRVYLRHEYETEKREAWSKLGNRLSAILAGGADIVELRRSA